VSWCRSRNSRVRSTAAPACCSTPRIRSRATAAFAAECRALPRPPLLHQQRLAGTAHPASSSAGWLAKGPRNSRFIGDNGRGGLPLLLQPPVALFKVVACTLRGLVDLGSALRLSQHFGGSESGGTLPSSITAAIRRTHMTALGER
jgi:hypothetical protein